MCERVPDCHAVAIAVAVAVAVAIVHLEALQCGAPLPYWAAWLGTDTSCREHACFQMLCGKVPCMTSSSYFHIALSGYWYLTWPVGMHASDGAAGRAAALICTV